MTGRRIAVVGGGPVPRRRLVSTLYEVTISHARSAPLRNVFRYHGDYR